VARWSHFREALRSAVVWDTLRRELPADRSLTVLDAGGGTGGFAVPLAEIGHVVTVVDPSPDSLAALDRRAREAGVRDRIRPVQGDADRLRDVVDGARFDVVLCHSVLELVDDVRGTMAVLGAAVADGGLASILVANRIAAVVAHAVAGRFEEAERVLDDRAGRWGDTDPLARRFTVAEVAALVTDAGLAVVAVHGVRTLADLVPSGAAETDAESAAALVRLERRLADRAEFLAVAGRLHVLARRG
jgi:2-polyprenyl-3-methyl-5-hydroxy-6-metoxy-1,4-benzoquinol methylase